MGQAGWNKGYTDDFFGREVVTLSPAPIGEFRPHSAEAQSSAPVPPGVLSSTVTGAILGAGAGAGYSVLMPGGAVLAAGSGGTSLGVGAGLGALAGGGLGYVFGSVAGIMKTYLKFLVPLGLGGLGVYLYGVRTPLETPKQVADKQLAGKALMGVAGVGLVFAGIMTIVSQNKKEACLKQGGRIQSCAEPGPMGWFSRLSSNVMNCGAGMGGNQVCVLGGKILGEV